jgi:uncharacterized SAM-binding protein YcdF (DUF218 family)
MNSSFDVNENQSVTPKAQLSKRKGIGCFWKVLIGLVLLILVLMGVGNFLIVSDKIVPADAIVVLSGGESDRLPQAARLFKKGYGSEVILTRTALIDSNPPIDPNHFKEIQAVDLGIPPEQTIITNEQVDGTLDEANAVLDVMQRHGYKSAIVVTDPYHSRRARIIFDDVFEGTNINVMIYPVGNSWYRATTWWLHPQGWVYTAEEYFKLLAYWMGQKR